MNTLEKVVRRRRSALVGLGLAAVALGLALFLPAESLAISCGTEFDYYNNAVHAKLVGVVAYTPQECGCSRYSWGTVTSYVSVGSIYCLPPPI